MKKGLVVVLACVCVGLLAFLRSAFWLAQRADYGWDPRVSAPRFEVEHPRVMVDEAHYNASSVGFSGRYWPFGRPPRADGFVVERNGQPLAPGLLHGAQVPVIANASGAPKPQFFGLNLPVRTDKKRGDPAFDAGEIEVVRAWVEQRGSLLLIADHVADGQLAGTPSVLFDAVAVILSDDGAKALSMEGAAIDFVRDAFGHLKAIAVDRGGQELLKTANAGQDAGVVDSNDIAASLAAEKTRQWDRETSVRTLA